MKSNLLCDYLNIDNDIEDKVYEYLRPEIESRLFVDGSPLSTLWHRDNIQLKDVVIERMRIIYKYLNVFKKSISKSENNILSSAYFGVENEFEKFGYRAYKAPWAYNRRSASAMLPVVELLRVIRKYEGGLSNTKFNEILGAKTVRSVLDLKNKLFEIYSSCNISSFICASSYPANDRLSIDVVNELGGKAILFQHGLPGVYESHMKYYDGSYDIAVWGDAFKNKYVALGVDPGIIHVTGHPYFKQLKIDKLRFNLDEILIITKAPNGIRLEMRDVLSDFNSSLLYLRSIQRVLIKLGVKKVCLRPHPSESIRWYRKFLDTSFFTFDNRPLIKVLEKITLVIGPTSSVFLDSTHCGVNYLVYEPRFGANDIAGNPIVMPFDQSDARIIIAYDENELNDILLQKKTHDLSFLFDYIKTPFDLTPVIKSMS